MIHRLGKAYNLGMGVGISVFEGIEAACRVAAREAFPLPDKLSDSLTRPNLRFQSQLFGSALRTFGKRTRSPVGDIQALAPTLMRSKK